MKASHLLPAVLFVAGLTGSHGAHAQGAFVNYGLNWLNNLSLGSAGDGANNLWGSSYIGFNLRCNGANSWSMEGNGFAGGAAGILAGDHGAMHFITVPMNASGSSQTLTSQQVMQNVRMVLTPEGNLRLGARVPSAHPDARLSVEGKIVGQAMYATSPANWADFVFEKSYRLMPLNELETYLLRNKHLPAIPAASEVETKGYDLSAMDAKLLQSLEELTLHVIELNKQNQQLQAEVATLREQVQQTTRPGAKQ